VTANIYAFVKNYTAVKGSKVWLKTFYI